MLIGEILLRHSWVDAAGIERALGEQAHTGLRLCSMLIARGLLDPDHAARALAEQHGVPAAMQRHLLNRNPALATRLPAELGRTYMALPIGETHAGQLVVCVRDPRPEIMAALRHAIRGEVIITVANARQLELLVSDSYGPPNEFDVDLSTNPFEVLDPRIVEEARHDAGMDLGTMTLVGLDDHRVAKDHSQVPVPGRSNTASLPPQTLPAKQPTIPPVSQTASPVVARTLTPAAPPAVARTLTPAAPPAVARTMTAPPSQPRTVTAAPPPEPYRPPVRATSSLELDPLEPDDEPDTQPGEDQPESFEPDAEIKTIEEVVAELAATTGRDAATDLAMTYAAERWVAALLLVIREGTAFGERGHGSNLSETAIRAFSVSLAAESIVREAHDLRRFVTEPGGKDRLSKLLGQPADACALPIIVGGNVVAILVVGDPIDAGDGAADLARLGGALASAYQRIARENRHL